MFWSSQTGRGKVRDSKFQPPFLHARDAWLLDPCLCLRTHGSPCPHPVVLASEAGILIGRKELQLEIRREHHTAMSREPEGNVQGRERRKGFGGPF